MAKKLFDFYYSKGDADLLRNIIDNSPVRPYEPLFFKHMEYTAALPVDEFHMYYPSDLIHLGRGTLDDCFRLTFCDGHWLKVKL